MIAYSASGRVSAKGDTPVTGKPEELDWLLQQAGDAPGAKRNTRNSAMVPLALMKELREKFPDRIIAVA